MAGMINALAMRQAVMANTPHTATASGSMASFSTDMVGKLRHLVVGIEPVQDLHGYDNPWPAGGGTNKWDEDWEIGGISSSNGQNVPQDRLRSKNYIPVTAGAEYYVLITTDTNKKAYLFYYDAEKTYTGNSGGFVRGVVTIPSGTAFIRFQCNENYGYSGYGNDIAINYPATVTTYSPYSNICPITGWTGANVVRTGNNLLQIDLSSSPSYYGCTVEVDKERGSITADGTVTSIAIPYLSNSNFMAGTYTLSGGASNLKIDARYYPSNTKVPGSECYGDAVTFTAVAPFRLCVVFLSGAVLDNVTIYPMLQRGAGTAEFSPYTGTTIPISWESIAGTVYGGTLDVVTGVLTVTYENISSYAGETLPGAWISDRDIYSSGTVPTTGAQVVYVLATPQTYQLSPTMVKSLIGTNHVWADTGDVESLTYWTH